MIINLSLINHKTGQLSNRMAQTEPKVSQYISHSLDLKYISLNAGKTF